jgi:iron complex outermembrane receptor protein
VDGVVHTPQTFEGLVTYREDGLEGDVYGLELQTIFPFRVLWDALDGFGAIATATFIEGELNDGTLVPGLSDEIYGVTLFYERGGFEARVAWTDRSEYLSETRGISLSLANTIDQGATLVDAQIGWDFGRAGFDGWLGACRCAAGPEPDRRGHAADQRDARQVTQYQPFGANYLRRPSASSGKFLQLTPPC